MIPLEEAARIFGDAFCKAASNLPDTRKIRSTFFNWSVHRQCDYLGMPGAWMFQFERDITTEEGTCYNPLIKITGKIRNQFVQDNDDNDDNDDNVSGFKGTEEDLAAFAEECAIVPLKEPTSFLVTNPDLIDKEYTDKVDYSPKEEAKRELLKQGIQFYWDTVLNYRNIGTDWGEDIIVEYLQEHCHVMDVIWVPNFGTMVEFEEGYRPEVANTENGFTFIEQLLITGCILVRDYLQNNRDITKIDDKVLLLYMEMTMRVEYLNELKLNEQQTKMEILVEFPRFIAMEMNRRIRENPEKGDEIIAKYKERLDEPFGKVLCSLFSNFVERIQTFVL